MGIVVPMRLVLVPSYGSWNVPRRARSAARLAFTARTNAPRSPYFLTENFFCRERFPFDRPDGQPTVSLPGTPSFSLDFGEPRDTDSDRLFFFLIQQKARVDIGTSVIGN